MPFSGEQVPLSFDIYWMMDVKELQKTKDCLEIQIQTNLENKAYQV